MEHALKLPGHTSLLVALIAFVVGAGAATLTYSAVEGASFELGSGGGSVRPAPHAGTSGGLKTERP
jgi:hypothetical protein